MVQSLWAYQVQGPFVQPKRGKGEFTFSSSYKKAQHLFNNRTYQTAASLGTPLTFHETQLNLGAFYAWNDHLSFWLKLPLVYRNETQSLDASAIGLSDVAAGTRFRLIQKPTFETSFDVGVLFPTGKTHIGFNDPTQNKKISLPLGKGVYEVSPSVWIQNRFGTFLRTRLNAGATFRFADTVAYSQTQPTLVPDGAGNFFAIPFGNQEINWGDEGFVSLLFTLFEHHVLNFSVEAFYRYRFETKIKNITIDPSSSSTNFVATTTSSNPSQRLVISPSVTFNLHKHTHLSAGADLVSAFGTAFFGKNDPVPALAFVESLMGNTYFVKVSYVY